MTSRGGRGASKILLGLAAAAALTFSPRGSAAVDDIRSRAAVVMDAQTGRILYAKNPELRLMPASTTKLMTALVVVERMNLSDTVTISRRAAETPATRIGLKEGDRVTVESLLYAALMKSANDATVALAEAVAGTEEKFVDLMNRKAMSIGAADTRFINPNGLPGEGQRITAFDLAKVMRHAIKYPVLRQILGTRVAEVSTENGKSVFLKNTNRLLWSDEELLGGKTGYTRRARHCFVCAGERDTDTIIVALLGAPSRELLWKESEELLAFGAKVMNKTEEPVVYLTRTDYLEPAVLKTTSHGKKAKARRAALRAKAGKHKKGKAVMARHKTASKGKAVAARHKAASKGKLAQKSRKRGRVLATGKKGIRGEDAVKG